jgi:hypothetical protein
VIGYVDTGELIAYAAARGVTITAIEEPVLLTKAMDYLDTLDARWQGERTDPAQELAWPRSGVFVNGRELDIAIVPAAIERAQMMLAIQAISMDLLPAIKTQQSGAVTGKSVGDVSLSYGNGSSNMAPLFPAVATLLGPYLRIGGGSNFNVSRI